MADDLMMLAVVVVAAGAGFYLLTQGGNFGLGGDAVVYGDEPVDGDADVTGTGTSTSSTRCSSLYKGSCCISCKQPKSSACTKCKSVCGSAKANCGTGDTGNCNDGTACGDRCAKGWCTSFRNCCSNHPGGCAKCGVGGTGTSVTNCPDLCRRRECVSYRKLCSKKLGQCTQCNCAHLCSTAQCGTFIKAGCSKSSCTTCSFAYRGRAYTGRVTFNQNNPAMHNNPNSATLPPRPNINSSTYGRPPPETRPVNPNSPIYMRPSQAYNMRVSLS